MDFHLLIFGCDHTYYAIPSDITGRVIRAVEITPVPEPPRNVMGIFDLQGRTTPVISFRQLLGLPEKEVEPDDMFIILHLRNHQLALMVDQVNGLFGFREENSEEEVLFPELALTRVVRWEERLVPVLDIDRMIRHEVREIASPAPENGEEHVAS